MNYMAIKSIYRFEMNRTLRTIMQSVFAPVISTSLYFIVFGSAIGSKMTSVDGVPYGAFIVPGLLMLSVLTESVSNASFGIFLPKFSGTIYELLSAPISPIEITLGYVGAAISKSLLIATAILITARIFVDFSILHPFWMVTILLLTSLSFCLLGFIIGLWADGFQKLQMVPMLVIAPLTFLGGSFYSLKMLPPFWQTVTFFNPIVYLINGFRWCFFGVSDVSFELSLSILIGFTIVALLVVRALLISGYKIKN